MYKLFLPRGGHKFWARQLYRLGYASQRETRIDRLMRRADRIRRKMDDHEPGGIGDAPPTKPKWMRWRTYERLYDQWDTLDARADQLFAYRVARLMKLD